MASCVTGRRIKAYTLQELCTFKVAENFDVLIACSSEEDVSFLLQKSEEFLEMFGICNNDDMPVGSSESTLFCINRYLKTLRTWWIKPSYIPAVIVKLKTVESPLIDLCVTSEVSLEELLQLFCVLPKTLRRLSLVSLDCTDDMLQIVAKRCPQLEEIDLEFCKQISDSGVKALCYENEKGDVCPNVSLCSLKLNGTKVTKKSLTFALENFPNLQVISHPNFCEDINDIVYFSRDRLLQTNIRNFKVLELKEHFLLCDLKMLTILCPYVTELCVHLHAQAELNVCAEFVFLKNVYFSFHEAYNLLPFLEVRGKTLQILEVYECPEFCLSLESLVKFCPELQYLYLSKPKFEKIKQFENRDSKYILFQLNDLSIEDANIDNLAECLMFLIDQSPNLERFKLINCQSLQNDLIEFYKTLSNCGFLIY